jgi:tRNA threonylcarbamoyladenosine modification (KEOPS) complex Cgi121 subunit
LLKHIEEFGKHVAIAGFRNVEIKDFEKFLRIIRKEKPSNVEIQFFDAKFVATWQHLYFAAVNALTAFKNRENISKSLAMESLLYASAQRQIRKAMKLLGIKRNSSEIAVLIIGEKPESAKLALSMISQNVKAKRDDAVLKLSKKKIALIRGIFGISDVELKTVVKKGNLDKALIDLVIERMALLATQH